MGFVQGGMAPKKLTPTMTAPTPLNRRTFPEHKPLDRSTIPEVDRSLTPTFQGGLDKYNDIAGQVMRNSQSGRTSKLAAAVMGAYVNSQPGGSKYDPMMLRHPGDPRPDWQIPDAPKFGIYSGVYGANKNPFAPTNITKDGRPAIYGDVSPFEAVTGKNLAQMGMEAQNAADEKAQQNGAAGPGKIDFGSIGRDPIGDVFKNGNLQMNVDQGKGGTQPSIYGNFGGNVSTAPSYEETLGARSQPFGRAHDLANARWEAQHNVWADNPFLQQDTQAYMMARTPENAGATQQFQKMYNERGMSPYERSAAVVKKLNASGPETPASIADDKKKEMDNFSEMAGLQAKGLYAMGMPGSAPYAGWYDKWDVIPPATSTTNNTVAQQLGNQIGKTGNIFQRDYGKQKSPARTAAPPTMVPTAGATASLYAAKEPTRGGKLARVPKGPAIPQAAPVQQRYALQGGGGAGGSGGSSGSALLDELRKTRTGLMQ